MLKRFTLLTLFTILFCCIGFSQSPNLKMYAGPIQKNNLTTGNIGVIGTYDGGFYMLRTETEGFNVASVSINTSASLTIDKYDDKMRLKKSLSIEDIPMTIFNSAVDKSFEFFYQDGKDNLWLFYSDLESEVNRLYKMELEHDSFSFADPILVSELKERDGLDRRSTYYYTESQDKSRVAVYSFAGDRKLKGSNAYVEVFDNLLNSEWTMESSIPTYREDSFVSKALDISTANSNSIKAYTLSNDGVFNTVERIVEERDDTEYSYVVYSFSKNSSSHVVNVIDPKPIGLKSIKVNYSDNGNLRIYSLYSDDYKYSALEGIYISERNAETLEVIKEENVRLPPANRNAIVGGKSKKEKKIKSNFRLQGLHGLSDGSVILSAEAQTAGFVSGSVSYSYRDILLVKRLKSY